MKNKILVVAGLLFIGFWRFAYSEAKPKVGGITTPDSQMFVSEAVNFATTTCSSGLIFVSTRTSHLYAISITSGGDAGSRLRVYDARTSTQSATNARLISTWLDGSEERTYNYNVGFASGIAIWNEGIAVSPACYDCFYFER